MRRSKLAVLVVAVVINAFSCRTGSPVAEVAQAPQDEEAAPTPVELAEKILATSYITCLHRNNTKIYVKNLNKEYLDTRNGTGTYPMYRMSVFQPNGVVIRNVVMLGEIEDADSDPKAVIRRAIGYDGFILRLTPVSQAIVTGVYKVTEYITQKDFSCTLRSVTSS